MLTKSSLDKSVNVRTKKWGARDKSRAPLFHYPVGGKYDCLTWPHDLYKFSMQNICFAANVSCGLS